VFEGLIWPCMFAEEKTIVVTQLVLGSLWGHDPWQAWLGICGAYHHVPGGFRLLEKVLDPVEIHISL
jgi:hypothetical protein